MSEKKLRILVAVGEAGGAASGLRELYPGVQDGLELTIVSAVSTLIATLEIFDPEVIFLDLSLARLDPLDAVRRVHRSAPDVPLIVLADRNDNDWAARTRRQGALDCLPKEFIRTPALGRILRVALEHNTVEGLADLLRDPLTGLYTRDGFLTIGERAVETARLRKSSLVLLCARIENLAILRTESGPSAIESALVGVTTVLSASFRRTDILARLGQSQFAALAVDAVEPSLAVLCQRLEKRLEVLNRDRSSMGPDPLELRLSARFRSSQETASFAEFLDSVEAELRVPAIPLTEETASCKTANAAEKK